MNTNVTHSKKLIILNKKQEILCQIPPYQDYEICLLPNGITIEELEKSSHSYLVLSVEIMLFHLAALHKIQIEKFINTFLTEHSYEEIMTPIGTLTSDLVDKFNIQEFSTNNNITMAMEEKKIPIPVTETLNSDFLKVHKMHCMFHHLMDSILLIIMKKESFLLESFLQYILHFNLYEKKGCYMKSILIFNNLRDALILLEKNHWVLNYERIEEFTRKSIDIHGLINMCNCNIMDVKNLEKEFYFKIQKEEFEKTKITTLDFEKRTLNLQLKKEEEINSPIEFYKTKILKCNTTVTKNTVNTKPFIKKKKIYSEINIIY